MESPGDVMRHGLLVWWWEWAAGGCCAMEVMHSLTKKGDSFPLMAPVGEGIGSLLDLDRKNVPLGGQGGSLWPDGELGGDGDDPRMRRLLESKKR